MFFCLVKKCQIIAMYMGENPVFLNEKMSKIGKDVVVRCIVMGGGGGGTVA